MKTIVIGGAGFIGHHLVKELLKLNNKVVVIDNLSTGLISNIPENIVFYNKDISVDSIDNIIDEGDIVFHLAAKARVQPSIENPVDFDLVNVHGLVKVLTSCKNKKIKRFIFSSSSSVYGNCTEFPTKETNTTNPISPYALQKLMGEQYCKLFSELYGIESVCLRYFNVYGSRQRDKGAYSLVTGIFMRQHASNQSLTITGDGEQRRDFISVDDVVKANVLASWSEKVGDGESINIGNGEAISINKVAKLISDDIVYVEKRYEPDITLADITKAKDLLDWNPQVDFRNWLTKYKDNQN